VSTIPIGYGTYGMQGEDIFQAIPRLKKIGYEALELTVGEGWPTAPGRLDREARRRLAGLMQASAFPPPVLMALPQPFAPGTRQDVLEKEWRELCGLGKDLNFLAPARSILTFTLGGHVPPWETGRERIAEAVARLARIAGDYGVTLAVEPHAGCSFDRPEKAVWLVRQVNLPHVRLNCDISHFLVQGLDVGKALEEMIPFTVHTHVKDAEGVSATPRFVLPGEGAYRFEGYFSRLAALGYAGPVVVEVSGHVWKAPGYEPWKAARFCFETLDAARRAAVNPSPAPSSLRI